MQIVIDISEEMYRTVRDGTYCGSLYEELKTGTPLPKGHGRLIDADEAVKTLKSLGSRDYRRAKGTIQEAEKMLSFDEYTPTIVEADKEESEEV